MPRLSDYYMKHIFNHIMIFAYGFLHTFRVGSVYVTLAVTFERFHAIICPLRHFKRKKYMLPACIVFAVVYNLPKYFELQIVVRKNFNLIYITNISQAFLERHLRDLFWFPPFTFLYKKRLNYFIIQKRDVYSVTVFRVTWGYSLGIHKVRWQKEVGRYLGKYLGGTGGKCQRYADFSLFQ